ncbi:hypothetical protein SAY87_004753 [Trapa incisa]|uniref:RING-type E3 ubiquitin transferase n=2 Tax=Trapa TaxID=22665 RepID=A0AAN7L652_TRANT|nr:hypothetical protein SAY87_004753 [Trapa incisa]KAK4782023.1 hypothetical protein SAY86_016125 [Trapa natans]
MSSPPPEPPPYSSSHVTIFLVVILVVFFLATFFVCLCKFFLDNLFINWRLHNNPPVNNVVVNSRPGLDSSVVQSFPTFMYSSVKEFRREKYGLECAICLLEFEDDNTLRLLTFCYHVFHQECIDLWLESHKTCPVCRQDLTLPPEKAIDRSPVISRNRDHSGLPIIRESSNESMDYAICIDKKDEEEGIRGSEGRGQSAEQVNVAVAPQDEAEKFHRSHSTGHSIVRNNGTIVDKYTLRFPDNVEVKITRGHTGSCITFEEASRCNKRFHSVGFGEVSGTSK